MRFLPVSPFQLLLALTIAAGILLPACSGPSGEARPAKAAPADTLRPAPVPTATPAPDTAANPYYPFVAYPDALDEGQDSSFRIIGEINGAVATDFDSVFWANDYPNLGYCWEGQIRQMLEKRAPRFLRRLRHTSSLSHDVYLDTDSRPAQLELAALLHHLFQNRDTLAFYLRRADRRRIDRRTF